MAWVWFHRIRLSLPGRIDQCCTDEITVRYGVSICDAERVLVDCLDRTPDVNKLEAFFYELIGFFWEVMVYAVTGCPVRLIDVNAADGATER
jgi:hypothetical protein